MTHHSEQKLQFIDLILKASDVARDKGDDYMVALIGFIGKMYWRDRKDLLLELMSEAHDLAEEVPDDDPSWAELIQNIEREQ